MVPAACTRTVTTAAEQAHRDAWKQQDGLSRTEAKRRYISLLIDTMHKYASPTPDARELVSELEFVWDQVKSNVPSSSSSSPLRTAGMPAELHHTPAYPALDSSHNYRQQAPAAATAPAGKAPLRVLSPVSQGGDADDDGDEPGEEFVDAPDSQYDIPAGNERDAGSSSSGQGSPDRAAPSPTERKWRRRVEQALVKMTAEVAALREQLEARRLLSHRRRHSPVGWLLWLAWTAVKHVVVDVVLLGVILLWMRRKKDRRLEGAVRVLLGDAVAQMQKVGGQQIERMGKMQLPKLPGRSKN